MKDMKENAKARAASSDSGSVPVVWQTGTEANFPALRARHSLSDSWRAPPPGRVALAPWPLTARPSFLPVSLPHMQHMLESQHTKPDKKRDFWRGGCKHAGANRKLALWTRPEADLLPLTHVNDAGPATLRLLGHLLLPPLAGHAPARTLHACSCPESLRPILTAVLRLP
jgi:hypothetical protein